MPDNIVLVYFREAIPKEYNEIASSLRSSPKNGDSVAMTDINNESLSCLW